MLCLLCFLKDITFPLQRNVSDLEEMKICYGGKLREIQDSFQFLECKTRMGTCLVVQWLRFHAFNAGGAGVMPGQAAKIPHALR